MIVDCIQARSQALEALYEWLTDCRLIEQLEFETTSDGQLVKLIGFVQCWDFSNRLSEKLRAVERIIASPKAEQSMRLGPELIAQYEIQPIFSCRYEVRVVQIEQTCEDFVGLELRFPGAFVLRELIERDG